MTEDFDVNKPIAEQKVIKAQVAWTEQTVFEALRTHFVEGAVAMLPQVASETGAAARRIADCIAMQLWPSRGLTIECVEIKTHRNDLIREYQQPEKGDLIGRFCDKFWIATPPNIVKQSDFEDGTFPKTWGCLEVSVHEPGTLGLDEDGRYSRWLTPHVYKVKIRKKALENPDALPPSRGFLASIMRNLQAFESPEAVVARKLSMVKHKAEEAAWESAQKEIAKARAERDEFRRRIAMFENITGLRTGVFDQVWGDDQLRKTHEKQKHLIQIAHSVEHSFEKARELANWLENRGKEMSTISTELKRLAAPPLATDEEES